MTGTTAHQPSRDAAPNFPRPAATPAWRWSDRAGRWWRRGPGCRPRPGRRRGHRRRRRRGHHHDRPVTGRRPTPGGMARPTVAGKVTARAGTPSRCGRAPRARSPSPPPRARSSRRGRDRTGARSPALHAQGRGLRRRAGHQDERRHRHGHDRRHRPPPAEGRVARAARWAGATEPPTGAPRHPTARNVKQPLPTRSPDGAPRRSIRRRRHGG